MADVNDMIDWLVRWNDDRKVPTDIRMLKITEEAGEAAQAYLGWLGANPRKGITCEVEDVHTELADVAIAALVALATLHADPLEAVERRARFVVWRLSPDGVVDAEIACGSLHPIVGYGCGRAEGHDGEHRNDTFRWV